MSWRSGEYAEKEDICDEFQVSTLRSHFSLTYLLLTLYLIVGLVQSIQKGSDV